MRHLWSTGALCCIACGGSTGPEARQTLRTGEYNYRAEGASELSPAPISGTLRITSASFDSVRGTWAVPAYQEPVILGRYEAP
jgi:hypothetical protein